MALVARHVMSAAEEAEWECKMRDGKLFRPFTGEAARAALLERWPGKEVPRGTYRALAVEFDCSVNAVRNVARDLGYRVGTGYTTAEQRSMRAAHRIEAAALPAPSTLERDIAAHIAAGSPPGGAAAIALRWGLSVVEAMRMMREATA